MATKFGPINYGALLKSDPAYQATLRTLTTQGVQEQAALTAARQAALINYGSIPGAVTSPGMAKILGGIAPDVTAQTRALAQQNTNAGLSTMAQLGTAYENKQAGDTANLAGRGMLQSGAYGQHQNADLQALQQNTANAQSTLLSGLGTDWQTYEGQQQTNANAASAAKSSALAGIISQINAGTLAAPTTTTPAAKQAMSVAPLVPSLARAYGAPGGTGVPKFGGTLPAGRLVAPVTPATPTMASAASAFNAARR